MDTAVHSWYHGSSRCSTTCSPPPFPLCQETISSSRAASFLLLLSPPLNAVFFSPCFVILRFKLNFQDNGLNALAGVVSLCPAVTGDLFKVEGGNSRLSEVLTSAAQPCTCFLVLQSTVAITRREVLTSAAQSGICFWRYNL